MNRLLVATRNPGKLRELRALLAELELQLITPDEAGIGITVAEDGDTYAENASKKATAFAAASGLVTLADDSGLEVEALDGAPGLHSARYVQGPDASDRTRRALLLKNLSGKPRPWRAQFRCAVAVATAAGEVALAEGACSGVIIPEERGSGGFGYDPVFLVAGTAKTMAELDMDEKNRISHRAHAVVNAMPILRRLLGS